MGMQKGLVSLAHILSNSAIASWIAFSRLAFIFRPLERRISILVSQFKSVDRIVSLYWIL